MFSEIRKTERKASVVPITGHPWLLSYIKFSLFVF